jgi:transcriptional regulator with XRE-family HTH domain
MRLRLREIREGLGWSQQTLAARAGCTRAAISHWECGRQWPPLLMIPRLADALGVPEAVLLHLDKRPRLRQLAPAQTGSRAS